MENFCAVCHASKADPKAGSKSKAQDAKPADNGSAGKKK